MRINPNRPFLLEREEALKLIAVDLDGTLLTSSNTLTNFTKSTLIDACKKGHKLVIITGRDFYASNFIADMLEFEKYGGLVSSSNGGHVYSPKDKKVIISHMIDQDLAKEMIAYGKDLGFDFIIYNEGEILSDKEESYGIDFLAKKNKMPIRIVKDLDKKIDFSVNKVLFTADPKVIEKNKDKIAQKFAGKINPIHAMPQFLDCMPPGINKGRSIIEIADYYGIDHKDTYAFGDEINDIEMIKMAGVGVAMGNANTYIKEIADKIALSNDEDGIAHFVRENIL